MRIRAVGWFRSVRYPSQFLISEPDFAARRFVGAHNQPAGGGFPQPLHPPAQRFTFMDEKLTSSTALTCPTIFVKTKPFDWKCSGFDF
jgi:hypothetical protein